MKHRRLSHAVLCTLPLPLLVSDTPFERDALHGPRSAEHQQEQAKETNFLQEEHRVLHPFLGEAAGDQFGWEGQNAGDCDGDGVPDTLISAPFKAIDGPSAGRVYLYSGKTGARLFVWSGKPDVYSSDWEGRTRGRQTGRVYVHSGADGERLFTLAGEAAGDGFGIGSAEAGDVDGDGALDFLVTAACCNLRGDKSGRVLVLAGQPPAGGDGR